MKSYFHMAEAFWSKIEFLAFEAYGNKFLADFLLKDFSQIMNSLIISDSAIERIREIKEKKENREKFLRISVSGGGCSGFQYVFELDDKILEGDIKIAEEKSQILAITDETSLPFLSGSEIQFIKELGSSYFKVSNPNAKASCGCGSSFSV